MGWYYYDGKGSMIQHKGPGRQVWLFSRVLFHSDVGTPWERCIEVDLLPSVQDHGRCVIYREGPMGDALLGLCATKTLARVYPEVEWVFLTAPAFVKLFEADPGPITVESARKEALTHKTKRFDVPFIVTCHELFELDRAVHAPKRDFRLRHFLRSFGVELPYPEGGVQAGAGLGFPEATA